MTLYIRSPLSVMRQRMLEPYFNRQWPDFDFDGTMTIPMDVIAEDEGYVITALIPGIKAEDLNIQVVNETVTISGELKHERDENASYILAERPSGRFSRTLTLPSPLNAGKAEADLTNGVLTLRVPKAEEAKAKSIKVISK